MSSSCGVPGSVRITTHMWRQTYAVQLYRADPGLLPRISLQFKHLDAQTTCEGYVRRADPDLTSINCSGCGNMLVLPEHRPFWEARREGNLRLLGEHEANGDKHAAAVPQDRVAQCDRMLQAWGDVAEGGSR